MRPCRLRVLLDTALTPGSSVPEVTLEKSAIDGFPGLVVISGERVHISGGPG